MDPSTKEISFDANDPEMTSFITNYTDRGTIIYWLEGTESADWFPNWTYESWQANCLTSPSSVHYGANIIDATLSAFLIAGTVSDTVESGLATFWRPAREGLSCHRRNQHVFTTTTAAISSRV